MNLQPNTEIRLLRVPLDLSYTNQISFNSKKDQEAYFKDKTKYTYDEVSYQRKDSFMRIDLNFDELYDVNYVMYKNNTMPDKWIYAFVTRMEYASENSTYVYIETDVFQTWWFDMDFHESFVEREMIDVNEDVPGANLIDEGLEFGEVKINGTAELEGLNPLFIVAYSRNPYDDKLTTDKPSAQGTITNGIPTGVFYCVCSRPMLQGLLDTINRKGFGEAIINVFSVPAFAFVGFNGWTIADVSNPDKELLWWITSDSSAPAYIVTLISTPNNLDGYVPKNKKLLQYPYLYIGFNPCNGNQKIYRYEDFKNGSPSFKFYSEVNPNPSVYMIPQNYRGLKNNLSDSSVLSGYPQIAWVTDYFSSWSAQNSKIIDIAIQQEQYNYGANQGYTALEGYRKFIENFSSGSLASAGADLAVSNKKMIDQTQNHNYYILNTLAQKEKQALLPNQANLGTNSTLLGYNLINDNIFTRYNIKKQFAKRIDDYFSMYGYITNEVKIPNLKNRPNWNYIKTIGANITGDDISQEDITIIKSIFDNGITIWHNPDTFLDYSKNNR